MSDIKPIVHRVKRVSAIAGQTQYSATVQYPNEDAMTVSFVGMLGSDDGVVVHIGPGGQQGFVTNPGRFGPFGAEWVRRFFA
jgi:hypothetical protein